MENNEDLKLRNVIRAVCETETGSMSFGYLCRSVSTLGLADPIAVPLHETVDSVMKLLQQKKEGCVLVLNDAGQVVGIFSERDYILKGYGRPELAQSPVSQLMTANPVTQPPDVTLAHVLLLMSHGGFRHIPIVDSEMHPLWLVSVKNVMDSLVTSMTDSLLDFEVEEE